MTAWGSCVCLTRPLSPSSSSSVGQWECGCCFRAYGGFGWEHFVLCACQSCAACAETRPRQHKPRPSPMPALLTLGVLFLILLTASSVLLQAEAFPGRSPRTAPCMLNEGCLMCLQSHHPPKSIFIILCWLKAKVTAEQISSRCWNISSIS